MIRFAAIPFMIGMSVPVFADNPEPYKLGPDSQVHSKVPHGTVTQHQWPENDADSSKVFPRTRRRYSVYVPDQYDGSQPAALMVFQDGHAYEKSDGQLRVPVVFDNLIAAGDMPVTIAVMIDPGHKGTLGDKRGWEPRPSNRSVEYDTVSGDYAKFLATELLPRVAQDYKITNNPELRAIGGASSGGICAFSVAWHRPDQFRKVFSTIGSFVDIRGGHNYPSLIRKTEKKPIRVFLQDGSGDLDNEHGNWPLANQQMAKALAFKGYDYQFVYGVGAHNQQHAGEILPEAMRWLWLGWSEQQP